MDRRLDRSQNRIIIYTCKTHKFKSLPLSTTTAPSPLKSKSPNTSSMAAFFRPERPYSLFCGLVLSSQRTALTSCQIAPNSVLIFVTTESTATKQCRRLRVSSNGHVRYSQFPRCAVKKDDYL